MLVIVVYDRRAERGWRVEGVQEPCGLVSELSLLQMASVKDELELEKVSKPDHKCIRTRRRTYHASQVSTLPLLNCRIDNLLNIVNSPRELPPSPCVQVRLAYSMDFTIAFPTSPYWVPFPESPSHMPRTSGRRETLALSVSPYISLIPHPRSSTSLSLPSGRSGDCRSKAMAITTWGGAFFPGVACDSVRYSRTVPSKTVDV